MKKQITTIALGLAPFFVMAQDIRVYKSPTCGCCSKWVQHLEDNDFNVTVLEVHDVNHYKRQAQLPYSLGSCHTAFVDGYAIEGHVPASDIKRLLTEKPDIRGLAVPGMPAGSPGMEYDGRKDAFQTLSYTREGVTAIFASH